MTKIIVELCQNHNGDIKILDEMVSAAASCGAEIVKIQSLLSKELTDRDRFNHGLVDANGKIQVIKRPYKDEYERLKKLDLGDEEHHHFINLCHKYKVIPMTTVFTRSRIGFLEQLNLKKIKVASFDCASFKMIEELAYSKFEEIIVSTGCTFDGEIKQTADILKKSGKKFSFLHCVSIYPTPLEEAHLERMNFLREFTHNVGLSEHSNPEKHGLKISIASLLYKPTYIERHFTILKQDQSKDGPVSLNPNQLKFLIDMTKKNINEVEDYIKKNIPEIQIIRGQSHRELSSTELLNRDYYRGRFASLSKEKSWIYNWEDKPLN
jgi:sialic acid synthase SpsE